MTTAKDKIELPKYMTAYTRRNRAAFKYQRDVPRALQSLLGRKRWDLSLGSDFSKAEDRCKAYTKVHDRIIAQLTDKDALSDTVQRAHATIAAAKLRDDMEEDLETLRLTWRDTEEHMKGALSITSV